MPAVPVPVSRFAVSAQRVVRDDSREDEMIGVFFPYFNESIRKKKITQFENIGVTVVTARRTQRAERDANESRWSVVEENRFHIARSEKKKETKSRNIAKTNTMRLLLVVFIPGQVTIQISLNRVQKKKSTFKKVIFFFFIYKRYRSVSENWRRRFTAFSRVPPLLTRTLFGRLKKTFNCFTTLNNNTHALKKIVGQYALNFFFR